MISLKQMNNPFNHIILDIFLPAVFHIHRFIHPDGNLDLQLLISRTLRYCSLVPLRGLEKQRYRDKQFNYLQLVQLATTSSTSYKQFNQLQLVQLATILVQLATSSSTSSKQFNQLQLVQLATSSSTSYKQFKQLQLVLLIN